MTKCRPLCRAIVLSVFVTCIIENRPVVADPPSGISPADWREIDRDLSALKGKLATARSELEIRADPQARDFFADADIFCKGIVWALRYDTQFQAADVALLKAALAEGHARADALRAGKQPWAGRKGRLARGYISAVDGSTQPFGLVIPKGYDPQRPMRLDVVLHGSSKPVGMSELRFIGRFETGNSEGTAPDQPYIELHPLGRVENCYRWAGETDVLDAIEAVSRQYNIDRDRIVLLGMSMGASGTWHLGLKHPDRFVALGPYCGYVDTHRFSETPLSSFIKVGPLPTYQEAALHMLDSVDYAANAATVPAIACMGEKDIFFQAHVIMAEAMRAEGIQMVNLISPGTGHKIDPVTQKEQMRLIEAFAKLGIDHAPRQLHFVTWTLKYNHCHWLELLGLEQHYARAELTGTLAGDGSVDLEQPKNVTRLALLPPALAGPKARLRVAGQAVELPSQARSGSTGVVVARRGEHWVSENEEPNERRLAKRPGLQGPIDDAFTRPFVCVRGTGQSWNASVARWSDASLARFADAWHHYFRGELPLKDDVAVTADDVREKNLILFGDPGSNQWISRLLPQLPLTWTRDELKCAGGQYSASEHVPVLIYPNPLPEARGRYIVLNSGHTFRERELAAVNYLLFPRLGDWAVLKPPRVIPAELSQPMEDEVLQAGFFDEAWKFSAGK